MNVMEQPTNRELLDSLNESAARDKREILDTVVAFKESAARDTRDVLDALLDFKTAAENEFIRIDKRFTEVDRRFDGLVAQMNRRFDAHDDRFDKRFDAHDKRFEEVNLEISELRREVRGKRKRD